MWVGIWCYSRREQRQAEPRRGQAHPGRQRGAAGAAQRARRLCGRGRGARAPARRGARRQAVAPRGPHRAYAHAGRRVLLLRASDHAQVQGQKVVPAVNPRLDRPSRSENPLHRLTNRRFELRKR